MNNKQQPTVRLVKCPRCSKLLPEPEHVPLYTCGGCGTTLKAKYYKGHDKDISHGRDVTRTNGMVHECSNGGGSGSSSRRSSSSTEHAASLDRGRDQVEDSGRNTAVNSSDDTSLSKDSAFLKNKDNGVIENKMDCSDSNDLDKRRDEDAGKSFSSSEQNGAASSSHQTALSESSSIERKEAREISNKDDQFNPNEPEQHTMAKSATGHNVQVEIAVDNNQKKQIGDVNIGQGTFAQEDSHSLEKKETQQPAIARESIEDEGDHEQKKIGYVASSALNELSDVKNPVLPDASDHGVSEETREIHLEGKHPHQDQQQQQQNQFGYVNSAKEASSLVESSAIMNSAESPDNEVSKDSRKMLLVGENSHQDQDEQRQTEYVNSSKEASSLAIENSVGPHASDHKVCEETKEMSLAGKHFHQDQNEQKQVGVVDSATDADSLSDSPAIKNPTACPDYEVSEATTKIHPVGKHPHQDKHDSSNDTSSLMVSSAIENLVEHDVPDHEVSEEAKKTHLEGNDSQQDQTEQRQDYEVSEETKKTHLVGKDSQQDQAEQRQDPTKDTSSLTNSVIEKLTPLASANSADASDFEVSGGRRKDLSGEHSHQDISGSQSNRFGVDEPGELENSGKESGSGRDVNNFLVCKVEQRGEVKSNEITQGGNESVSLPSNANNLKTSPDMGATKVLRDARNEISDHGKRTSKQNVKKFRDAVVYSDAEVGNPLREFPRHPSKRSPAYDSSVSSFDGNDDQGTERPARVGEETLSPNNAVAGYDGAEESPEWTNSLPELIMYRSNSRVQTQTKSTSSVQLDKKLKNSMAERGGPLEEEYDIRRKINRYRPDRDNFIPRVPNRRRSSEIGFETGSSSSYAPHDEPPSHQMPPHPYRRRFHDVPHWRGKEFLPAYYNSETSGEIYDRPGHRAYVDGRRQAENWSRSGTLPRIPYSGEMISPRHPCMHRYPDDRRWSAQLPPPAFCCHQGAYMGPAWEPRWDPYDSYPTSPQRYVESESLYAWGPDTISLSDDQRYKDQIMRRLYLREKRQALKRQFHPTAGGAPFISCYSCFNILQLPKDFLISSRRRRTHKLQCGACSSVLEFSLENERSLARYETNIDRNANQDVSSSHAHHSRHSSLNSADSRELLSHDSFKASNRENRKLSHGSSRRGEGMEGEIDDDDDNATPGRGRPTKVSWQLPARNKSPLHRLMGYSSPKDLLSMHEANDLQ